MNEETKLNSNEELEFLFSDMFNPELSEPIGDPVMEARAGRCPPG
ncbi:hypothetical protein [Mammaliicoccus sciuri]